MTVMAAVHSALPQYLICSVPPCRGLDIDGSSDTDPGGSAQLS